MTWWSTDAPAGDAGSATEWAWDDIAQAGVEPVSPADSEPMEGPEVRHRREVDEAWERGRLEGEQAAEERSRRDLATAVAAAESALESIRELHETFSATLFEDMLALSCAMARAVIGRELRGDPAAFADLVRRGLAAFPLEQPVRVRVHPEDLSRISAVAEGEVIPIAGGREVRWVADAGVLPGGCVMDGPDRVLDGRVDQALERIFWELTADD